jgi:hypothetical protein
MKRSEVFPSKYLNADGLNHKPITLTIKSAPYEKMTSPDGQEQRKIVLSFRETTKTLPLNMVNWDSVAAICGDDTNEWLGQEIELYPTKTQMGGKLVDCIRIRAPAAQRRGMPADKQKLGDDLDDEIPLFGTRK